jgi:hypothetical protein
LEEEVNLSALPHDTLLRLVEMDGRAERHATAADAADTALAHARALLNGRAEDPRVDITRLREEFGGIHAAAQAARCRADADQRTLSRVKSWVAQLPNDTVLEEAAVDCNGHDLGTVRAKLVEVSQEISDIESAPLPPVGLHDAVAESVAALAWNGRPEIRGSAVHWPLHDHANRRNLVDFDSHSCNALLMFAWLFPQQLADRIEQAVMQHCTARYPLEGRQQRVAALRVERDQLERVEAALITAALAKGLDAGYGAAAPAAILGVRVKVNGGIGVPS